MTLGSGIQVRGLRSSVSGFTLNKGYFLFGVLEGRVAGGSFTL